MSENKLLRSCDDWKLQCFGGLEVSGRGLIDQVVWKDRGEGEGYRTVSRVSQPRSSSADLVNTSATSTPHLSLSKGVKTPALGHKCWLISFDMNLMNVTHDIKNSMLQNVTPLAVRISGASSYSYGNNPVVSQE